MFVQLMNEVGNENANSLLEAHATDANRIESSTDMLVLSIVVIFVVAAC